MNYPAFLRSKVILFLFMLSITISHAQVTHPKEHFGFYPGAERMMFDYESLIDYLQKLEKESPRVKMEQIGESSKGKPIYVAFFSSPDNINELENLRRINKELALNPNLPDDTRNDYINKGKVFFVATLSMHSSEVGPTQAAPLIAHKLVTTNHPDTLGWLDDVVYMMVPCHNPDGMNMIVNHYEKYKGTKYEGSSMPGVYHKYVGHNINRDFVTITQKENQAISRIFSNTWFPQVMVEKHQMGSTGPRYFVPPNHDPIAENIDAGIWNWMGIFGMNMIKDMTREELHGISQHYAFDNYWPGSTETCIWKNVIGFLTEAASVKLATPVYIEPNELSVWGKGLAEYKKSINMPKPWKGGWWRLNDITDYEVASTMSVIKTSAVHKTDILKFRNDLCRAEVERGRTQAPYYFIFPKEQKDKSELVDLVNLLEKHGVKRFQLQKPVLIESTQFQAGDVVIPLAQPFRPFIKEVLEKQNFPVRYYTPGGEMIRPYDITSWSLPLHKGVKSYQIDTRSATLENALREIHGLYALKDKVPETFQALFFPFSNNESYKMAFLGKRMGLNVEIYKGKIEGVNKYAEEGGFIIQKPDEEEFSELREVASVEPIYLNEIPTNTEEFRIPKIGLVETWMHDMDAGWTRYLLDTYHIPYEVLRPDVIPDKDFKNIDVLIFPDENKSVLLKGNYERAGYYRMSSYPPEYAKGMGKEGLSKLMKFVNNGGKIVTWGGSTELFMGRQTITTSKDEKENFQLPISNVADRYKKDGLYVAGSLVSLNLDENSAFTLGMGDKTGVFYRGNPVFGTSIPMFDMDRRVVGNFSEEHILLSGYGKELEKLSKEPAMVWVKKGDGEMIFFSFSPQFRASTTRNYKLIFNSLLFSNLR